MLDLNIRTNDDVDAARNCHLSVKTPIFPIFSSKKKKEGKNR